MTSIPQLIILSPDVLSGTPVFAGTRVPVKNLLDYLRAGDSVDTFLEDFPSVKREQVDAVLALVETLLIEQAHARAA
jgi:uncharacterized protein (DUF433 family)